jgi:nucleotide-binding universal stress UspA family protein
VHTVWDVVAATTPYVGARVEPETSGVRRSLAAAVAPLATRYPEVRVRLELGRGVPSECLLAAAANQDLVVVGHHHRHGFDRLLHGSVALAILDHASTPVAVVPIGVPARIPELA